MRNFTFQQKLTNQEIGAVSLRNTEELILAFTQGQVF